MSDIIKSLIVFVLVVAGSCSLSQKAFHDSHDKGRVVNGMDASYEQFPYFVSIENEHCGSAASSIAVNDGYHVCKLCGGALIGPEWILSAAHCVDGAPSVKVYLGIIFDDYADECYDVTSDRISMNPGYNSDTSEHDLALLMIPKTNFCERVNLVPLPKLVSSAEYPNYVNEHALTCGFGETATEENSKRLQWTRMRIIDNNDCKKYFHCVTKAAMCADSPIGLSSPSHGDSGGPLVLESTGELVGVIVGGAEFVAVRHWPILFTRVTDHLEWIKSISGIYY